MKGATVPVIAFRNIKTGPSIFSIPDKNLLIQWEGAGDPSGRDIQEVDVETQNNSDFRRAVRNGIFAEVTAAEAKAAEEAQFSDVQRTQLESDQSAIGSIDYVTQNDLIPFPCQGPRANGRGDCEVEVPVKQSNVNKAPVLCPSHAHLAPTFAQVETGAMIDVGDSLVPETNWVPAIIDRNGN